MSDSEDTAELRSLQAERARAERRSAEQAPTDDAARAHDRRAEKAAYLAAKLAERERSENK